MTIPLRCVCALIAIAASNLPLTAQQREVNSPVAPEAIYIGTGSGSSGGISVADVNGFGQGTGDLSTTNFPLNPNVGTAGVIPSLAPGTSARDAGGAGPLTLTQDDSGNTNLVLSGQLGSVRDLQIGHPLDKARNNSNINPNASSANQVNPFTGVSMVGNTISIAPHPNPPRLLPMSPNPAMGIDAEEPTVTSSQGPPGAVITTTPPCVPSPNNQLTRLTGLLGGVVPGVFYGPQPMPGPPPPPLPFCPFTSRQQIGHYLYALDESNDSIAVYDSNRFTRLATLTGSGTGVADIAISPNLTWLAASCSTTGVVEIYDIDPLSPSFHQLTIVINLAPGIGALAWQPETEDLLVTNGQASTLSLIDVAGAFTIRSTITDPRLSGARSVIAMPRETGSGLYNGVYFAYILNGNDEVAVYESGPTVRGFDTIIGTTGQTYRQATTMQPYVTTQLAGFWIAHQDAAGLGQVSRVQVSGPFGTQPTTGMSPGLRGKTWTTVQTIGGFDPLQPSSTLLSGNDAVDLAFDDTLNAGALPDFSFPMSTVPQATHSGKGLVKNAFGTPIPATFPQLIFIALADTGRVDVFDITSGARLTSLLTPGVRCLAHYWRQ